jgi:hypothetical protein
MPFSVTLPVDEGKATTLCDTAYRQALGEVLNHENLPSVNFPCLGADTGSAKRDMETSFVNKCLGDVRITAKRATKNSIDIAADVLQSNFDDLYGDYYRNKCLDQAVAAEAQVRGRQSSAAPEVQGENCFAFECGSVISAH